MTDVVPDAVGACLGWRAWSIRPGVLTSMNGEPWPAREALTAVCGVGRSRRKHDPPGETCSCGIYAAKTRDHLESMSYPFYDSRDGTLPIAVGEVWLWGGVIEGTQGWRAQFAYPKRVFVPHEAWRSVKDLRATYRVPVRLDNTLRNWRS